MIFIFVFDQPVFDVMFPAERSLNERKGWEAATGGKRRQEERNCAIKMVDVDFTSVNALRPGVSGCNLNVKVGGRK